MKTKYILILILFLLQNLCLLADGIIVSKQEDYPYDFLKNKVTDIKVEINGLIAETIVTQEFENEWNDEVSGVFSFPLPLDARATRLQYSIGDTLVDAVLKVKPQSINPGTGEGGVIAEINQYMGANALRIKLSNIPPHGIKTVVVSYISTLKQYSGMYEYNYPLNTGDFIKHPLDYLKMEIKVNSSKAISLFGMPSHPEYSVAYETDKQLVVNYLKQKAYTATDVKFYYQVENAPFSIDLYNWKPDSSDGYMAMVGKPQIESADSSMPQDIVFLLSNSTTMIGNKINQSKKAIALAISSLSAHDSFNILVCNSAVTKWKSSVVSANEDNIADALAFIETIEPKSGNRIDIGINSALLQLLHSTNLSSILAFTDGRSPLDPELIEEINDQKTAICFIAIGNDIDRIRMETVAKLNYGFVAYINENNVLAGEMVNVFEKIKNPLLKELEIHYSGATISNVFPKKLPTVFAGSDLLVAAMYQASETVIVEFNGVGFEGEKLSVYEQEFIENEISRKLWAKSAIDDLEGQILIYGENDSLKNLLIDLSLMHNIRCRYTSFNEDSIPGSDTGDPDDGDLTAIESADAVSSKIVMNYPNPFIDYTVLRVQIDVADRDKIKTIELYDVHGRLIKVINISYCNEGVQDIVITRSDLAFISNGIVIAQLKVGNKLMGTTKMVLINN